MGKIKKIVTQKIEVDENYKCYILTKFDDGFILNEPVTSEEAAQFKAENEW